jgi:protein O-GlcNAc transferase
MTNNALQLSVQHLQKGDFDRAEETLRGLLREEAGNVPGWCLLGRIRQARGRADEALALFQQAAQLAPHSAEIHSLAGSALVQLGWSSQAQACLEEALRLDPFYPDAYNNLGKVHLLNQHADEALACFREAVRLQPGNVEMLNNLALVLIGQRRLDEARPLLEQVVQLLPNFAGGHLTLSALSYEQGELQQALDAAQRAMQLDPQLAAAYAQLGAVLLKMGRHQEAVAPLQAALRIAPRHAQASEHLSVALLALGRQEEALAALRHAVELDPNNVCILVNLVTVLVDRGRWAEVVPVASRAMQLQTNSPELLHNLGLAYLNIRQAEMAIAPLEQALKLRPDYPEALCSLGWAFTDTGQLPRAAEVLEQARRLKPDFAEALNNLGLVYNQLGKIDESCTCYEQAVALRPDFSQALGGLANVYKDLGRLEESIACYRRCIALDPHPSLMYSNLLLALHFVAGLSPEEIYQEHLAWARHNAILPAAPRPHLNDRDPERRLRIGYVSADFRRHVMGWYTEMVLENHDRQRFEVFCYANQNVQDQTTHRLQDLADHWRIIHYVPDEAVEEMIRRDRIDLLIDLSSHSGGNRLPLFARKAAPVQATHFGLQYTTANPGIDYRITDAVVDPPGMTEPHNTEQIVRLPEIHWCYRPDLSVELNVLPASSAGHLTFGFLGAFPKITPAAIEVWSEVLHRFAGSRFVVLAGISIQADRRLRDAFAARGIDPGRLILVGKQARSEYFRLYHRLDLYLDSFPCTGCNTTCDALWMGVPVVMLAGRTGMARQGASPLAHLGLHDLITETPQDYVETAVRLAADLPRLREWRATLRGQMSRSTLMNPQRFTRQLEEAYRWMWRQWCRKPERSFNNL